MTKVMVIEDNDSLRSLMALLLEMEGFEVVFGPSQPQEVLSALEQQQPQVLILDVHLSGHQASGFEIVQAIRQQDALRQVRVILISGMDYGLEASQSGADAFLSKPFMGDELIAQVRALAAEVPPDPQE